RPTTARGRGTPSSPPAAHRTESRRPAVRAARRAHWGWARSPSVLIGKYSRSFRHLPIASPPPPNMGLGRRLFRRTRLSFGLLRPTSGSAYQSASAYHAVGSVANEETWRPSANRPRPTSTPSLAAYHRQKPTTKRREWTCALHTTALESHHRNEV